MADAGNRRPLPVAEVASQHQHALAALKRLRQRVEVIDADDRRLARGRKPAELEERAQESPQMRVVRLREANDLVGGYVVAVHARQVRENDAATDREPSIQNPARE